MTVTVSSSGIDVSVPSRIGSGLQFSSSFSLGASNHGGVSVTLTSSDPSRALLSPDSSTPGSTTIQVFVSDGSRYGNYYVQGVEDATGSVSITASAPGFTDGTGSVDIVQPALRIYGLNTSTSTLSDDDPFYIQVGVPNNDSSNLYQVQQARAGGGGLSTTVSNSNAAVGQLASSGGTSQSVALSIAEGSNRTPTSVADGGVAFDPLGTGSTDVAATISGFIATDAASMTVFVSEE